MTSIGILGRLLYTNFKEKLLIFLGRKTRKSGGMFWIMTRRWINQIWGSMFSVQIKTESWKIFKKKKNCPQQKKWMIVIIIMIKTSEKQRVTGLAQKRHLQFSWHFEEVGSGKRPEKKNLYGLYNDWKMNRKIGKKIKIIIITLRMVKNGTQRETKWTMAKFYKSRWHGKEVESIERVQQALVGRIRKDAGDTLLSGNRDKGKSGASIF